MSKTFNVSELSDDHTLFEGVISVIANDRES
jgi:hypothetical protein